MKCQEFHKENDELYSFTQGGTIENLKYENGLEKDQIYQLMLKLKEKEIINNELENELYEVNETLSAISRKNKVFFLK
jgi:hypothetical protein